ncbi:MAG TPA: hypothetical protein VIW29_07530 [Polyangiaceae bacterium]
MLARIVAVSWGLGLVALAALPMFRAPTDDGFPFSTYPMFARPRERPLLYFAEGVTRDRRTIAIPPELVANGPVMQAMQTLAQAAQHGPAQSKELCRRIARRLQATPRFADVRRVQLVSARFDPVAYFERGPERQDAQIVQRCSVGGGS